MSDLQRPQVTRFFTAARRIPLLIGKVNGTRIWGGPYTLVQLFVGGAVLWAGYKTMGLWGGHWLPLVRLVILASVAFGATWASGRIPTTRRKLSDLALDLMSAVTLPDVGTYKGSPVRIAKPHYVTGTVLMQLTPLEQDAIDTRRAAAAVTATPTAAPASQLALESATPATPVAAPVAAPAPEPVPALEPAAVVVPDESELPANVTPIRRTHATGLERLLEQARKEQRS